eukprot:COSAG01_NODE_477_length_16509_cov_38.684217_15_plen_171_part_00
MQLGGLGLSSAEWTSAAAYTAGWTDFLRFMSENTHVFPALSPHITAAALSTSQLAPVLELRAAWDFLADFLTVDHDDISVARDGHETLRVCLGETVTAPYLLARAKAGGRGGRARGNLSCGAGAAFAVLVRRRYCWPQGGRRPTYGRMADAHAGAARPRRSSDASLADPS